MPDTVSVHTHTGRVGRQIPGPHHAQGDAARQVQATVLQTKAAPGVVQRRLRITLPLPPRHPGPPPNRQATLDVLLRLRTRCAEVPNDLLLRHRTTLPQPPCTCARLGQHFVELRRTARHLVLRVRLVVRVHSPGLGHALIPHPPAPVPLRQQQRAGGRRHTQPIRIPSMPDTLGSRPHHRHDTTPSHAPPPGPAPMARPYERHPHTRTLITTQPPQPANTGTSVRLPGVSPRGRNTAPCPAPQEFDSSPG